MKNSNLLVIGDVHGNLYDYENILKKCSCSSIQVGDFGFSKHHKWHLKNINYTQHKINFGNHDDYTYLREFHSLGDFSIRTDMMTVRGAFSIDKICRTENISWWSNEELNYEEMQKAIDFYILNKPKIMITHDCPQEVRKTLFKINEKSITSNGLQIMFEAHQPELWIFGHHHKSKNELINNTRFVCLKELETMVL